MTSLTRHISDVTHLTVQSDSEEDEEEEHGPQLGQRHGGQGVWIRNESETGSCADET